MCYVCLWLRVSQEKGERTGGGGRGVRVGGER